MKTAILIALVSLTILQVNAQPGTLDLSYGTNGRVALGVTFTAASFQPDGKLVGVLTQGGNVLVQRYNTNGSLDASFGSGGTITADLGAASDQAISVAVGTDGNIVVLASTIAPDAGIPSNFLVLLRYNSNGVPDASFGMGGIVRENVGQTGVRISNTPHQVTIQNNGRIVVTIQTRISSGSGIEYDIRVRGFNVNGTGGFNAGESGTVLEEFIVTSQVLQPDGKIIVGGSKITRTLLPVPSTNTSLLLLRYNADGTGDASFGTGGMVTHEASDSVITLAVQNDKILVSGTGNKLLRFNSNGTPDAAFGAAGVVTTAFNVRKILVRPAGRVIVGGSLSGNFALARYNENGTLDVAFGTGGLTTTDFGSNEGITDMNVIDTRLYAYGSGLLAAYRLSPLADGPIISNTSAGVDALISNTTGTFNTAYGYQALRSNTTGSDNTATGVGALYANTSGNYNTAYGVHALRANTTGAQNTGIGVGALLSNTTGSQNTATGTNALQSNSTGFFNTAGGNNTLFQNTTGFNNTAYGYNALRSNITGINNVAVGYNTSSAINPLNGTFVGAEATASGNFINATALGYGAIANGSNQVRVGNTAVSSIGGQVGWTNFSDGRYKKNMKEDVPGLEFITKLRPITYTLDIKGIDDKFKSTMPKEVGNDNQGLQSAEKRAALAEEQKAKEEKSKIKYTGFVAQEVEAIAKKMNYDFSGVDVPNNKEGFYGLRYSDFVVPLVKSVQELDAENKQLKVRLNELEEMVHKLVSDKGAVSNSTVNLRAAYLEANQPNPFTTSTIIKYHVPQSSGTAQIVITNQKGQVIKNIAINKGEGQANINAGTLPPATYIYSLLIDGKQTDSKQMVIIK